MLKDKPVSYYAFLTLYWTGIRLGELLALSLADFDAEEKTLSITKSYQRINGRDVITEPKTAKGKRVTENSVIHSRHHLPNIKLSKT